MQLIVAPVLAGINRSLSQERCPSGQVDYLTLRLRFQHKTQTHEKFNEISSKSKGDLCDPFRSVCNFCNCISSSLILNQPRLNRRGYKLNIMEKGTKITTDNSPGIKYITASDKEIINKYKADILRCLKNLSAYVILNSKNDADPKDETIDAIVSSLNTFFEGLRSKHFPYDRRRQYKSSFERKFSDVIRADEKVLDRQKPFSNSCGDKVPPA